MRFKNRSLTLEIHPIGENVLNVVHRRNTHENEGKNLLFQRNLKEKYLHPQAQMYVLKKALNFSNFPNIVRFHMALQMCLWVQILFRNVYATE